MSQIRISKVAGADITTLMLLNDYFKSSKYLYACPLKAADMRDIADALDAAELVNQPKTLIALHTCNEHNPDHTGVAGVLVNNNGDYRFVPFVSFRETTMADALDAMSAAFDNAALGNAMVDLLAEHLNPE